MSLNFRGMFQRRNYSLSLALAAALFSGCDSSSDSTAPKSDAPTEAASPAVSPASQSAPASTTSVDTKAGGTVVFTTANGFDAINAIQNVTLSPSKEGLSVRAATNDPALGLPLLSVKRGAKLSVHIQLSSPGASNAQVFYNTTDARDFNEAHSVRTPTRKGDNNLTIEVSDPNFLGRMRLDPGELPGDYVIKLIEVTTGGQSESPSAPSPSASISR